MHKLALLIIFQWCSFFTFGQNFLLKNPSFEGIPNYSTLPEDWKDAGFPGESKPDLHPSGAFRVDTEAYEGQSYLGLVVRDNNTWESIYQRLEAPLISGEDYQLNLALARSELYISVSRITKQPANFNSACILRVWGGGRGKKVELLAETSPIIHTSWKTYSLTFRPGKSYPQLFLEAYYSPNLTELYNGNILVDDLSLKIIP